VADDVLENVEEETAASVAPTAVSEPLAPVVERLEHVVDRLAGVVQELPQHTEPEAVTEPVTEVAPEERDRDEIPIRKPWTHRMPFGRRDE